jgi:phosphate transport system substrate-binding protein
MGRAAGLFCLRRRKEKWELRMMRSARRPLFAAAAFALVIGVLGSEARAQDKLIGSGASFPAPIYQVWFKAFSKETPGVIVDFQSKGSGAGIQDFINHTVDFAASDAAMTDEEIAKVQTGVVLIPITAGEIVLAYNLPGVTELKLPHDVYPDIFLGKITRWNDPKIAAANPNAKLPDLPITVVRRSDASGTNFVFTKHLSAVSPAFAKQVGFGTTVEWPATDKIVGAPKNDGVTATIKQTPGAIGYIEYGFAKLTKTPYASLQNKAGNYVQADAKSGEAALGAAKLGPDLRGWVDDPDGADAYPIATFTWLLFYKQQDAKKADILRKLVEYCATKGQAESDKLGYIPLPAAVVAKVKAAVNEIK